MKPGYAHITMVVDRSGSMGGIRGKAEEGVNGFIAAHKAAPGTCTFLLRQFDENQDLVYGPGPIGDLRDSYVLEPRGMTALFDAVGIAITETGEYLSKMSEADRPEKVIFVVQTDGEENASKEYTDKRITQMVKHQQEVYSWEILFLGADLSMAKRMGILDVHTSGTSNTNAAYAASFAVNTASTLGSRAAGATSFNYTGNIILPDGTVQTIGNDDDDPDAGVLAKV